MISTHAPHAGSDEQLLECLIKPSNFNPRSPCGERHTARGAAPHRSNFNPRSPCGERQQAAGRHPHRYHFNPRSPCGERPLHDETIREFNIFQPTLPMRGATDKNATGCSFVVRFQPTLPMRGATRRIKPRRHQNEISTHAPHAGSDITGSAALHASQYFNPRSPCGERLD